MATSRGEEVSEDAEVVREARLSLVRNAVNQNKIKLWTEPYHTGDSAADQAKLMELGSNLAPTLDLDEDTVTDCLRDLQVRGCNGWGLQYHIRLEVGLEFWPNRRLPWV